MNKNLNLCKILKDCKGIKLYSTMIGNVFLKRVEVSCITVECEEGYEWTFNPDGTFTSRKDAECIIFPSKEQRDWSKFERSILINTPMMCTNNLKSFWILCPYKYKLNNRHFVTYVNNINNVNAIYEKDFSYIIPFDKFNPNNISESLMYNIQK